MADDDKPRPFRRERNLSNRNFNKRRSSRRISVESHSSVDSLSTANANESSSAATDSHTSNSNSTGNSNLHNSSSSGSLSLSVSSSLQYSYSVNTDTENGFNRASIRKMVPLTTAEEPQSPDPSMLGVRQKVHRFETLSAEQRILFKTGRYQLRSQQTLNSDAGTHSTPTSPALWRVLPSPVRKPASEMAAAGADTISTSSSHQQSIDEERSVDDVDDFSDFAEDEGDCAVVSNAQPSGEYNLPEEAHELCEGAAPSPLPGYEPTNGFGDEDINANALEYGIDDFGKVESVRRTQSDDTAVVAAINGELNQERGAARKGTKDFPRNYRSTPRPKTEIISTENAPATDKCKSLYHAEAEVVEEEIELRDKSFKYIQPILEELIKTEETYVENLKNGLENYGNIFQRKDLPPGLRGKKYVLLGNIGQIYEFHEEDFLPMLQRNRRDLKRLFDEFQHYIDQNFFYCYVIFTMNKQRSLKLCDVYKNYFKRIQNELDDKLGINSFLVQPIQRMARYPLLLQQFITTLFKHRDFNMKPLLESCCRLEKKMRTLLTTTNESEVINDIVDCNEFNVFHQGKFRKVSDFNVFDHTLKRSYRGKVFIFDKCIIYTEIKGKSLIFHGRYPCEHVGITTKPKVFTLYYERRKQQECDFSGEPALIELWLELIRDMVNSFANEERQKLQARYSRENDHLHRKPTSLSLFRDSNRFSSDSGIGNIWVMPKPELDEPAHPTPTSNRTTWYAAH